MADSVTVSGGNISKTKQDTKKVWKNLLNKFKRSFKWAKKIFYCHIPLRKSILRVSLFHSPGFIELSRSFQFPTVQISPGKDRFRCSHEFVKIWDRSRKKRDLIFSGCEFVRLAVLEFLRFRWSRVNARRIWTNIRPVPNSSRSVWTGSLNNNLTIIKQNLTSI